MALTAAALLALMFAARLYRAFLPGGEAAGGCGFWLVCGGAAAALLGGSLWLWRRDEDD